jgi:ATPase subunit of ABC transporter with duplicated ATPase domains
VAELEHVSKRFGEGSGDKTVMRDFSCRILRGDKIGLIGPNGSRQDHAAAPDPRRAGADAGRCAWAAASRWPISTSSAASSIRRRRWSM